MLINSSLVESTLVRYGVMQPRVTRSACVPPVVLQVSRFDPYKGPLELITAFVEAAKLLPLSLQREVALAMASSLPEDNPSGIRLARLLQEYIDSLDLSEFPEEMRAGGPSDLRKRMFLLLLDDKAPWERLCARLAKNSGFDKERLARIGIALAARAGVGGVPAAQKLPTVRRLKPTQWWQSESTGPPAVHMLRHNLLISSSPDGRSFHMGAEVSDRWGMLTWCYRRTAPSPAEYEMLQPPGHLFPQ